MVVGCLGCVFVHTGLGICLVNSRYLPSTVQGQGQMHVLPLALRGPLVLAPALTVVLKLTLTAY